MEGKNVLVGVIFVVILYVIYIYAFKKKHSSLLTTQKVEKPFSVDISGNNSSNAYSMWLYISEWDITSKKHIMTRFHKEKGDGTRYYSPTVYLEKNSNTMHISYEYIDQGDGVGKVKYDDISISDFPIQSWTNLIISTNTKTVDVYINGKLIRSHILNIPPHNPSGKLYLGRLNLKKLTHYPPILPTDDRSKFVKEVNSYMGYISTVNYYDEPITPSDAWSIYNKGYDDAGLNPNVLGKYKIKMSILDNNREMNSLEI
jgi:hypothetical protein